ncbi:protein of unknown function YGGT [Desulfotomaculum nigrificans CO-1-SRB]|uniref:YggT family protein n=1 Tax=Desulfotomaculum nigrificans (strain DSM 14880 / VKM B-2319 / CO-1-SRB) TaxID=868595 RepID=F6B395_DESCC|nr:YggT family protein [Desulfotomaculum nigrificans]AEF95126.1 protein of unknown function YGGT [Desulfotomaculum nigrificans CO-1-SRB]
MDNLVSFINVAFWVYEMMLFVRILLSWFRPNPYNPVVKFLYETTDPYLNIFRRLIPPIGMVDISPIAALYVLHLIRQLILGLVLR